VEKDLLRRSLKELKTSKWTTSSSEKRKMPPNSQFEIIVKAAPKSNKVPKYDTSNERSESFEV
jgi:hypothetical protein